MPRFRYEAKRGPEEKSSGVLDAENQRAAVTRLIDMGFFPVRVEEDDAPVAARTAFLHSRIRLKDRNVFFRQLATLFASGMPLTRALSTLEQQTEHAQMRAVVTQLREHIQRGSTFAEALQQHPKLFTPVQCNLVLAGESGGMLDDVLWRIVEFGEQEEELRGKAVSAMIYPAFLLIMGSLALFILMAFVFPKFITVFDDFEVPLPLITQVVMAVCGFLASFWWAVLLGLAGALAGAVALLRNSEVRKSFDGFSLRAPLLGKVMQKYQMAQFSRTLGTLLDNGVPVLTSLQIVSNTMGNRAVAADVAALYDRVAGGDSISAGLAQSSHFPPMVVNMFAVGEESGRLGEVTKRMADAYDLEVERAVKAMTSLLEPLLILIMGIFVGVLVVAMLLPMLTLSATIQ